MKSLIDPIIQKIAEADNKKSLIKLILVLLKNKADMQYVRTALNKLYVM